MGASVGRVDRDGQRSDVKADKKRPSVLDVNGQLLRVELRNLAVGRLACDFAAAPAKRHAVLLEVLLIRRGGERLCGQLAPRRSLLREPALLAAHERSHRPRHRLRRRRPLRLLEAAAEIRQPIAVVLRSAAVPIQEVAERGLALSHRQHPGIAAHVGGDVRALAITQSVVLARDVAVGARRDGHRFKPTILPGVPDDGPIVAISIRGKLQVEVRVID